MQNVIKLTDSYADIYKAVEAVKDGHYSILFPDTYDRKKVEWGKLEYAMKKIAERYDYSPWNAERWDSSHSSVNDEGKIVFHTIFNVDMSYTEKDRDRFGNLENLVYDPRGYFWDGTPDPVKCIAAFLTDEMDQE